MKITIRVFGELTSFLGRRHIFNLDDDTTVNAIVRRITAQARMKRKDFLGEYRISGGELAILVNGINIVLLEGLETSLQDGDEVVILPPVAGGG